MIETHSRLAKIHELLARHGLPADAVEIVSSVIDWCARNDPGWNAGAGIALAYTDLEGRCRFVLVAEITDAMKLGVLGRFDLLDMAGRSRPSRDAIDAIEPDSAFF